MVNKAMLLVKMIKAYECKKKAEKVVLNLFRDDKISWFYVQIWYMYTAVLILLNLIGRTEILIYIKSLRNVHM